MSRTAIELNHRERATLRAVDTGHAEITCSGEPDLFLDGVCHCDQACAHSLAHRGFVQAARRGARGQRVPAELTAAGRAALRAALDQAS